MAITVRPFDGSSYSANIDPDSYHQSITTQNDEQNEGVLYGWDDGFLISGVATPLDVTPGRALVNGKEIISTAHEAVIIAAPALDTRVDVIVLEVDYVAKTADAAIILVAGVEGAGAPAVTWTPGVKVQLPLGTVSITVGGVCTCTPDAARFLHFASKVDVGMLDDGVLTNDVAGRLKMADGFLSADAGGRAKMADGYITVDELADGALTANAAGRAKMADGYITFAEMADGALTADAAGRGKMADGYITVDELADGALTANAAGRAKMADGYITFAELADGALTADAAGLAKMADGYLSADAAGRLKMADGYVTAAKLDALAFNAANIADRTRTFFVQPRTAFTANEITQGGNQNGQVMQDGIDTNVYAAFLVPSDFVSTMTVTAVAIPVGTGNCSSQILVMHGANGEAINTHTASSITSYIAVTSNQYHNLSSVALPNAAIGDYVLCRFFREGSNGGDTVGNAVHLTGFLVSYTADM